MSCWENKIPLEKEVVKEKEVIYVHNRYTYEKRYRSKLSICGIPLVDINVGRGRTEEGYWRVAKGIIVDWKCFVGVISIGLLSVGTMQSGSAHTGAIVRHRSACIILLCHWLSGYRLHQHRCDCYRCIQYRCDFHRVKFAIGALAYGEIAMGQIRLGISYTICAPPIPAFWIRRNTCSFRNTCPENHCRKSLNSLYR